MNTIKNFIEREGIAKEVELLEQVIKIAWERGIVETKTHKRMETYKDTLYNMLEVFDKSNLPRKKKFNN